MIGRFSASEAELAIVILHGEVQPQPGGIGWGFTDRSGGVTEGPLGSLNLGRVDNDPLVGRNFEILRQRLGLEQILTVDQVHSADVVTSEKILSTAHSPSKPLHQADGIVATDAGVGLAIRVADCVPVLLADSHGSVIGAAHAGRVGIESGVIGATIEAMRREGAHDIHAWVGPHICAACYEVSQEMAESFSQTQQVPVAITRNGTPAIDLGGAVERQLGAEGVTVDWHAPCTLESPRLFSYRRNGASAGRQIGIIWIAPRVASDSAAPDSLAS